MNEWSKTIWNVPKMLETYATKIPIEYITSILRFLCINPLIPAFNIGNETYKKGAMLTINDNKPIEDMLMPVDCLIDSETPINGSHPLNIKTIKITENIKPTMILLRFWAKSC